MADTHEDDPSTLDDRAEARLWQEGWDSWNNPDGEGVQTLRLAPEPGEEPARDECVGDDGTCDREPIPFKVLSEARCLFHAAEAAVLALESNVATKATKKTAVTLLLTFIEHQAPESDPLKVMRDLCDAISEETNNRDGRPALPLDYHCFHCTLGTVPDSENRGPCAYHRARNLAGARR